jgi:hypothetical protein
MVVVSTTSTVDPVNMYNNINTVLLNPKVLFIIIVIILIIVTVASSSLGGTNEGIEKKSGAIGMIVIVILIILIIINAFQYFLNVNITAYLYGFLDPQVKQKKIDIVVKKSTQTSPIVPEIRFKKQVYNIPGNYYTFNDAKAVCQAYGSDLASYEQIEKSYENGAEWCNYGWSADQLALYPTQQKTYDNLQQIEGHEHDCGRPGVNGGFIGNPSVRFGVNCYGNKPKITQQEEDLMKTATPYPETKKDRLFQKKVDYWKQNISQLLVSPFNHDTWGEL